MQATTSSPFKFLDSFTRADREIFFGREKEIEELYARVFESNMLLVYGASGTGKTSLIQCGLANKFNESDWMPILVRRGDNMTRSLTDTIRKQAITPIKENARLKKCIESLYLDHFKPIYLLFDQFEELFIFGNKEEIDHFIDELKAVIQAGLSCKFIFIIRGEYLENLSRFEEQIPEFFQNRIRIEKMTRTAAQEAILGPCRVFNIPVEEGFAQSLLDKISPERSEVELTYLQVFLDKLYKLAVKRNPNEIGFRNSMLQELGNISDVLADFLEEQLATIPEANKAVSVLKSFVSTEGTKRQLSLQEAGDFTRTLGQDLTDKEIEHFVNLFVNLRILRDKDEKDKYELRHDSLAAKIYEKITLTEKELLQVRQLITNRHQEFQVRGILLNQDDLNYLATYEKQLFLDESLQGFVQKSRTIIQTNRRLKRRVSLVSLLSLMLLVGAVAFYFYQQNQLTRANELAAMSLIKVDEDPTLAYLLAEKAYELNPKGELIQKALINAYRNGPFYLNVPGKDYLIDESGKHMVTSSDDSTLRFYSFKETGVSLTKTIKLNHENHLYTFPAAGSKPPLLATPNTFVLIDVLGPASANNSNMEISVWNFNGNKINSRKVASEFQIQALKEMYMLVQLDSVFILNKELKTVLALENKEHAGARAKLTADNHILLAMGLYSFGNASILEYDAGGRLVNSFELHQLSNRIEFSRDGNMLFTGMAFTTYSESETELKTETNFRQVSMYNRQGKKLQIIKGFSDAISLSPDEQELLAKNDSCIGLFTIGGKLQLTIKGNFEGANMSFSPDGESIYVMSGREYTDIYNRADGQLSHRIKGDLVRLSNDSKYALTVDDNERTVELYTPLGKHTTFRRMTETFADEKVSFTANNQFVVTGSMNGNTVSIWKPSYQSAIQNALEHKLGPDGQHAICMKNGTVKVLDVNFKELFSYTSINKDAEQIADFSGTGKMIIIQELEPNQEADIHVFDVHTGKAITKKAHTLQSDKTGGSSFVSFDDLLLGYPEDSAHIALYALNAKGLHPKRLTLEGVKGQPTGIAFSPASTFFVTTQDSIAQVWRYDSSTLQTKSYALLSGHHKKINRARFSKDGKFIITASDDSLMGIWNLKGELINTLNDAYEIPFAIADAYFSDNESTVVFEPYEKSTTSSGGISYFKSSYNLWTNIPYGPWLKTDANWSNTNAPEIKSPKKITISSDGKLVCTTEEDFVRLRTIGGHELLSVNGYKGDFSKDGKTLYLSDGKTIHQLPVQPDEIVKLVRTKKVFGEPRSFTPREIEEYGLK